MLQFIQLPYFVALELVLLFGLMNDFGLKEVHTIHTWLCQLYVYLSDLIVVLCVLRILDHCRLAGGLLHKLKRKYVWLNVLYHSLSRVWTVCEDPLLIQWKPNDTTWRLPQTSLHKCWALNLFPINPFNVICVFGTRNRCKEIPISFELLTLQCCIA